MKPEKHRQTVFRIAMGISLTSLALLGFISLCLKEIPPPSLANTLVQFRAECPG